MSMFNNTKQKLKTNDADEKEERQREEKIHKEYKFRVRTNTHHGKTFKEWKKWYLS